MYTKEELIRYCINAQRSFYGRPTFFINLLKTSLRNNDMTYVQSYLSIILSSFRNSFLKIIIMSFFRNIKREYIVLFLCAYELRKLKTLRRSLNKYLTC